MIARFTVSIKSSVGVTQKHLTSNHFLADSGPERRRAPRLNRNEPLLVVYDATSRATAHRLRNLHLVSWASPWQR